MKGILVVPNIPQWKELFDRAHRVKYTVHPGTTKMHKDLKRHFWWNNIRKDMAEYVTNCYTCQQVEAEHKRPTGTLQRLLIPEWKWEQFLMDFIVGLPRTRKCNDSVWVIVDRLTKSPHFLPAKTNTQWMYLGDSMFEKF